MEIVNIEANAFMEMNNVLSKIEKQLKGLDSSKSKLDEWLDNQDVCILMNISDRKLLSLRQKGIIPFSRIDRKVYYEKDDILAHVQELTPYLEEQLDKLVDKYPVVAARRGKGFMQGLVITGTTVGSIVTKALENGLLVISAGSDVLRLVPPLVITKENIDEMIEKLEKSLA